MPSDLKGLIRPLVLLSWFAVLNFTNSASGKNSTDSYVRFIAEKTSTNGSGMLDVSTAGQDKIRRQKAEKSLQVKKEQEQRTKASLQKVRQAKDAQLQAANIERRKALKRLTAVAKQKELEKIARVRDEAIAKENENKRIENERLAREYSERKAIEEARALDLAAKQKESERVAEIARLKSEEEERLAQEARRRSVQNLLSKIQLIGFVHNRALLVFPDDKNRALVLGAGESYHNVWINSVSEKSVDLSVDGESAQLDVDPSRLIIDDRKEAGGQNSCWCVYLEDAQKRINSQLYEEQPPVQFTITKDGRPTDLSSSSTEAIKIVERAGPFRPLLPDFMRSIRIEASLSRTSAAKLVSVDLNTPAQIGRRHK